MKKLILIQAALFLSFVSFAQTDSIPLKNEKNPIAAPPSIEMSQTNGILMNCGRLIILKKGEMTSMKSEIILDNGTQVLVNGSTIKTDGSTTMLNEGDYLDISGLLFAIKNSSKKQALSDK